MASVLIDTKTYKITIEIVKDFINYDFLNFLKKGYDPKSEKIITWEMLIYCKMLNGKSKEYINYHLVQLKKLIEEKLNENLYLHIDKEQKENFYIKTYSDNKKDGHYFITPEVRICENPALIKISFYCDESKIIEIPEYLVESEILKHFEDLRKITYFSQLQKLFSLVLFTIEKSDYFIKIVKCKSLVLCEIIKYSKCPDNGNYKLSIFGLLYLIISKYYSKIRKSLTEVTGKELVDEAIKQVTTNQINREKLLQIYNTREDFIDIHINKFYKLDVIRQINKLID